MTTEPDRPRAGPLRLAGWLLAQASACPPSGPHTMLMLHSALQYCAPFLECIQHSVHSKSLALKCTRHSVQLT